MRKTDRLENQIEALTQEKQALLSSLQTQKDETALLVEEHEIKIAEAERLYNEQKEILDEKELRKLALAYGTQESEYKNDVIQWRNILLFSGLVLLFSTIWSVWLSSDKIWYDRFEFYLIDFVCISAVWFCASQYTYYLKLRNDYAHRKTIAQSFHNILGNITDQEIKDRFIEKAIEVLCAPAFSDSKENLLSKKIVSDVLEIGKSLAK